MATGGVIWIHPKDIKYTQDSIKAQFRDGRELTSTLEDLLYGRKTVEDIPRIEVVEELDPYEGFLAMTGHRRLYLYKKLEQLGVVEKIQVFEWPFMNYWSSDRINERKPTFSDIRLRGSQGELRINQVIDRWRSSRPSIRIRDKQPETSSVQPTYQRTNPKEESEEASVNSTHIEIPLEQFASNDDTTENKEVVVTDEDPLLEDDEKIATTYQPLNDTIYTGPAISYQPLRKRSYARINRYDDDGCCSCWSCTCCSWCCSCC